MPVAQPSPTPVRASGAQAPAPAEPDCIEPEPMLSVEDYDGPFKKIAAHASRKLERRTAHKPHHRPGAVLCSLTTGEKFRLFVLDAADPVTFAAAGFTAGLAQAQDDDHSFGQGAEGYGKRYGAALADQASYTFFRDFLYPSIFSEDPRYYRLSHGSGRRRLWHAMTHVFVAHRDSGRRMFNFSEWMGTTSAQVLGNLYHPGTRRGFQPAARGVAYSVASDIGLDILREFWPDMSRKFKIPFIRRQHGPGNHAPQPTPK